MGRVFRSSDEQLKNLLNFQKQGYHFRWAGSPGSEGRAVTASPEGYKAAKLPPRMTLWKVLVGGSDEISAS